MLPVPIESPIRSQRQWYVVKTKPRQEEQTSVVLGQRGLEIFLPKLIVWTGGIERTRATRMEPLFPGYLFARLDLRSTDWMLARSAPGVAYFLGALGVPSAIPEDLVEDIRARADAQKRHGWPRFKVGDRVTITRGPLAGLEAVFDGRVSPAGRSRVLIEILSRLVPVVVPDKVLRRAG